MSYNPMSVDDYDAIDWLEERSKELPALATAWNVFKHYYEECKKELKEIDTSISPFRDAIDRESVYGFAREAIENERLVKEIESFLGIGKEEILALLNEKHISLEQEWIITKIARLYNMHVKLGHSARITYVAEQELQNIPERKNTETLRRTVLLSAMLHDVGRFYQAAHYNNLIDSRMKQTEDKIGGLEVDHAVAGYYYSLASALELHKLSSNSEEEEILRYITEAIAAVVVKCHQKSNMSISYFDYAGSSQALDDEHMLAEVHSFLDQSYENAQLMNYDVEHQMDPKHKEFIDRFVDKMKSILFTKELDYTAASGFDLDTFYTDKVYEELSDEIHVLLKNMQGLSSSEVSAKIVEIMNQKVLDLSHEGFDELEKKEYQQMIEESLQGMLNYDVALSIEDQFKRGDNIPNSVRFLLSSAMSMTMDADKIDILNQRALGIFNTGYYVNSFEVFPTEGKSLREILNQYFHFDLGFDSFQIDSRVMNVLERMNPEVFKMIRNHLGEFDIFDENRFPKDSVIQVAKDRIIIQGVEYPCTELYQMFQEEWISYISRNMNLERGDFKDFKEKNYRLLQISISREDLDANLRKCSEEERVEAYRNLLVSDGLKKRFMLEENNRMLGGWIHDSEDSEHLVHSTISGLLWQLNQFIMVNMRNKHSYEFIENNHILDQIYEQYVEKDPMIADIIKEYIDYCKKFIHQTLMEAKSDTLTSDELREMRQRVYEGTGEERSIVYS